MRPSNKSRSRNKNQNRRSTTANVINRVFDSSGPESKVRGTPQQIIDKYQALARDAQLAGDRVAAENFLQHSEHYARLLGDATREQNQRREQQESQQQAQQAQQAQQTQHTQRREHQQDEQAVVDPQDAEQPDLNPPVAAAAPAESDLVETPEALAAEAPKPKRQPRRRKPAAAPEVIEAPEATEAPEEAAG